MRLAVVVALLALPLAARAQEGVVSPGMTRAQVLVALGTPATVREASEFTYLFYTNQCGKSCGMNDLVVLRRDSVVDAIFRSSSRRYTGTSSSPTPIAHADARARTRPSRPMTVPPAAPAAAATSAAVAPATSPATARPAAEARPARVATPDDIARLRRELLGAGLTTTQIRNRLREQGFAGNLLDEYMRGTVTNPVPSPAPAAPAPAPVPTSTRPPAP